MADGAITLHNVNQFFPLVDGNRSTESLIVDEFERSLTLLADLPLVEATDKMKDRAKFMEPYEYNKASQVVDLDHGAKPTNIGGYEREQPLQMREGLIEYNKKHAEFAGAAFARTVNLHVMQKTRRIALDMEHDVFYGNPLENTADAQYMWGLYARFNKLTDEDGIVTNSSDEDYQKVLSTITLNAGGTTSGSVGSAFVIVPGEDAACFCYPYGSQMFGFQYEPHEYEGGYDENGGYIRKRSDIFRYTGGLSLRQRHAAIRIANVDYSTTDGIKAFIKCLYRVGNVMPMDLKPRVMVYIPQKAVADVNEYLADQVTMITPADLGFNAAFQCPYLQNVGFLRTSACMTLSEELVV